MRRLVAITWSLSLLTLAHCAAPPEPAVPTPVAGYVGENPSSVPGCPYLIWRLATRPDGTITGIVYYSDLSGLSTTKGSIDQFGKFHFALTSALGEGPIATVDGMRTAKGTTATMKGAGCAIPN